jgi:hypothetical protein
MMMLDKLRDMIARSGTVEEVYGGYEITVTDSEHFPWHRVIMQLENEPSGITCPHVKAFNF